MIFTCDQDFLPEIQWDLPEIYSNLPQIQWDLPELQYLPEIEIFCLKYCEIYLRYILIYLTVRCTWVTMRFTWVKVRGFVSTSPTVTIFLWHNHILIWDSSIPSSLHIMLKCLSSFCRPKQIKLYIIKKRKCITSYLFSNYQYSLII